MNIAFSFALVYSHVLDLSLCLSCLLAQRASENKAQTAYFFFSLFNTNGCVCVLYCNFKDSRQTPKGAFHQRSKQNIDPARNEMEGEEEKKRKRGI